MNRLDQLPREPSSQAVAIAALQRQITELRGQQLDLSAADALMPPLDLEPTRWPQTTQTTYTAIARCYNVRWRQQLRLILATAVSGGGVGTVRVLINGTQWGPTTTAGNQLDYTGPLPTTPPIPIGSQYQLTIEAVRTSGAGTVHAQAQMIRHLA
ncbi:hypothetical protein OHV05_24405 [Kitasatospora sp. NBC_00070]|uniref:hypothetical protein n=1 Tax=Kitasatospora sp. NBC_00070 TaxID=2975962 RepID=UPI003247833F